jgi:hypothetical protein
VEECLFPAFWNDALVLFFSSCMVKQRQQQRQPNREERKV